VSDTLGSLLGSAGANPKIKKKGSKYIVEGIGEFSSYEEAEKALTPDPLKGEGPMMTSGESAMDFGDEHQPGAKAPNSAATPANSSAPEKPARITQSEKKSGIEYEWDAAKKQWRPKKSSSPRGTTPAAEPTAPTQGA
jgi:hypothetical protein